VPAVVVPRRTVPAERTRGAVFLSGERPRAGYPGPQRARPSAWAASVRGPGIPARSERDHRPERRASAGPVSGAAVGATV